MKRRPVIARPRPPMGTRRIPRSRTEAAVELVRCEFERARLEREADQCRRRSETVGAALTQARRRGAGLVDRLTREDDR